MFRGCLGNFYGRFTRGDVLQRSDARTHARAREVQVRLTDDFRDVKDCLRDVSSFVMSTSVVYSCAERRFLLTDVH